MKVRRLFSIMFCCIIIISILATVGVYANWAYPTGAPDDKSTSSNITLSPFHYVEGDDEMIVDEVAVTERFVQEVNKMIDDDRTTTLDEIVDARKDRSWFTINELAADDPNGEGAQLRELLGLADFPELTVVIKFVSGGCGFELFTTRVDVDAKDEHENYIIPESEFANETTYIYPVNRITFKSNGNGGYEADKVSVGYSRTIYYYDYQGGSWGNSQSTKTRTYDVSTWAEGSSISTAVEIESAIIGREITVQNIAQEKEAYFKFSASSRSRYYFTSNTAGLTGRIYNSSGQDVTESTLSRNTTYYLKLTYTTTGEPENFKFVLDN